LIRPVIWETVKERSPGGFLAAQSFGLALQMGKRFCNR
jgi:hypothetical protein